MVSVSKSEEWSEPDLDLNLHVSDNETDGCMTETDEVVDNEKSETKLLETSDEAIEEEEDLEETVVDDIEDFLPAETIVKADFEKEKLDECYDSRDADEDILDTDMDLLDDTFTTPKVESKDNGDLLLIVEEKPADQDATEYENSVVEQAERDNEDATLKEESLNCTEGSKSPSLTGNEESEDRTDRNSPDDLMDIGDNVLDIGEPTIDSVNVEEVSDERTTDAQVSENSTNDSIHPMEVDEKTTINGHEEDTDENKGQNEVGEIETEENPSVQKELSGQVEETSDTMENTENTKVAIVKPGRGRPRKYHSGENGQRTLIKSVPKVVKSEEIKSPQTKSIKDSNKENVQDKVKLKAKEAAQYGVTTRSLRKRVSSDACENETPKKFKSDTDKKTNSDMHTASESNSELDYKSDTNSTSVNTLKSSSILDSSENPVDLLKPEEVTDTKQESDLTLSQLLNTSATVSKADYKWAKLSPDSKSSFRKLMSDKGLKSLSRESLETFIVQKICESLVYKSEMARLNKCLKDRESTVESLQREVVSLSKQAKDMVIVHEKLLQDLQRFENNPEEPLLIPRITRSVGLQACARDSSTKKPAVVAKAAGPPPLVIGSKQINPVPTPQLKQILTVAQVAQKCPATTRAPVSKSPKSPSGIPVNVISKPDKKVVQNNAVNSSTPARGGGASVIDLTSDDDKKATPTTPQLQRLPNGSKIVPQANGHKIVMVNGHPVMVKIPTNQQANLILNNGGIKVIATTATPVRGVQPSILRTTNSVNAITTPTNTRTNLVASIPQRCSKLNGRLLKPKHPAPFPTSPQKNIASSKPIPPRPQLTLSKTECGKGIILSWKINSDLSLFSEIASYQIYAYQETDAQPRTENWSKVGDVKALQLPMAVTLTQFVANNRYYFSVRAVDVLTRVGPFSEYQTL